MQHPSQAEHQQQQQQSRYAVGESLSHWLLNHKWISADPISLRKVTSESTDSSCIIASLSSWVSGTWLIVFKALAAFNYLNSILKWAKAEASVREGRLLAGPPGYQGRTWYSCRDAVWRAASVAKIRVGHGKIRKTERLTGNLASDVNQIKSSLWQRPTMTAVYQGSDRQRWRTVLTDDDDACQRRRTTSTNKNDARDTGTLQHLRL